MLFACSKREERAMSIVTDTSAPQNAEAGRAAGTAGFVNAASPVLKGPGAVADSLAPQRMIIRTATMTIIVANTEQAINAITTAAERNGGYINDSKVWREGELLRGTLSLRVPASRLSATLAAVRGNAVRVQSESSSSQEVTEEFVDLESRLRNLEAAERELLALMTTIRERSRKASEVLEMHQQINNVRAEIEQIRGRMRYLSQMTSMSTLNVELVPDAIAKPVVEPGWQPLVVVKDAGRQLVSVLQSVANAAIWFVVYLLPVLLMLFVVTLIAWKLIAAATRQRARYNAEA
jgi:chromosome segregation ATPase